MLDPVSTAREDRFELAERLLRGSRLPVASTEDQPIGAWEPSRHVQRARRLLTGVDRLNAHDAADRLALAAGELLGAARLAWWPIQMQGELEVSADEKPAVEITEAGFDDTWLGSPARSRRALTRELRDAVDLVLTAAIRLEQANPETVGLGRVETVALPAVKWATRAATLSVELDQHVLDAWT